MRLKSQTEPQIAAANLKSGTPLNLDDSHITIYSTWKTAVETIAAHEHTILEPVDHQAFFAALDRPPAPTERLRAAFSRHKAAIDSR